MLLKHLLEQSGRRPKMDGQLINSPDHFGTAEENPEQYTELKNVLAVLKTTFPIYCVDSEGFSDEFDTLNSTFTTDYLGWEPDEGSVIAAGFKKTQYDGLYLNSSDPAVPVVLVVGDDVPSALYYK